MSQSLHRRQQRQEMMEKLQAKAAELVEDFKDEWQPVADNLDKAMKAFDDLEGAQTQNLFL